jgi:hypothetical protein
MTRAGRFGPFWLALALAGCLGDGDGDGRRGQDRGDHVPEVRVDPRDARSVSSVKLTRRVLPPVAVACRAASREESLRVPTICPGLVPDLRIVTERDNPNLSVPFPPDHYELTFNTAVPAPRHWVVGVGRPSAAEKNVLSDTFHVVKGLPKPVKRLRVGSERVAVYWYPPPGGAVHEGHVIALARMRDLTLWASIHGRRYGDAATAMVLDMARSVRPR